MAEKPSDCWALPLKHSHHMAQHHYGDEVGWWSAHGIDPFNLAIGYYGEYEQQHPKPVKPRLERKGKPKRKAKIASRGFDKQKRKFR